MNGFERALLTLAPTWAGRRVLARANAIRVHDALELYENRRVRRRGVPGRGRQRAFEGAARGRRTQGWVTVGGSANAENLPAITLLRDRCRDLVRNNSHGTTAVRVIASQVVGAGIRPKPVHDSDAVEKRAGALWEEWAESTACDPEGRTTFYGMQLQAVRSMVEGGEMILRQRPRRESDQIPGIPLQLQLLEGDFIDTRKDGRIVGTRNRIVQGIEFDARGRRIASWLFPEHPGDSSLVGVGSFTSKRIRASQLSHVFRTDRLGQVRGISWAAPVIVKIHDYDAYSDNEALRNVVATSYSAFVQDIEPGVDFTPAGAAQALPGTEDNQNSKGQPIDELESGTVEYLPPGKTISFSKPPQNEGFPAYSQVTLRAIAKGFGITYEALTGDLKNTSFSSGRLGFLDMHRDVETWRRHTVIPQFCAPTWRWFVATARLAGILPEDVRARWTPPRREMINPQPEIGALVTGVRAGFFSLSEGIRTFGFDPETVLREIASDLRLAQAVGISLTTDGRLNPATGGVPPSEAPDPEGDTANIPEPEPEPEPDPEPPEADEEED